MVSVMSFIVYGGVSGETVMGDCSDEIGIDAYFNPDTFIIISTFFGKILFFMDVFAILKLYKYKGEAFAGV